MRKTKTCAQTWLQTAAGHLVMRTCFLHRQHLGKHQDARGAW